MVVASDPKKLNLAQQLAVDREQWLREANRVTNHPKNQSDDTRPVDYDNKKKQTIIRTEKP